MIESELICLRCEQNQLTNLIHNIYICGNCLMETTVGICQYCYSQKFIIPNSWSCCSNINCIGFEIVPFVNQYNKKVYNVKYNNYIFNFSDYKAYKCKVKLGEFYFVLKRLEKVKNRLLFKYNLVEDELTLKDLFYYNLTKIIALSRKFFLLNK